MFVCVIVYWSSGDVFLELVNWGIYILLFGDILDFIIYDHYSHIMCARIKFNTTGSGGGRGGFGGKSIDWLRWCRSD